MKFRTSESLSEQQIQSGLNLVIKDGLATEIMSTLTGGTFLVAMAIQLGATNVQLGLLAALPILTNLFQVFAIWLVQKNLNRRVISVFCNLFARLPLLVIAIVPLMFSAATSLQVLILLLFFHYLFGSIAGASWNSWMKDLVPGRLLGSYFSHRSRLTQILNVTLCLFTALVLDHVKNEFPQYQVMAYATMFLLGGTFGLLGVYVLSRTPEPTPQPINGNLFRLFTKPLVNGNFRKLLAFHCFWAFAINMVTPFFSVYMMKTLGIQLSSIVGLGIVSQLSSIFSIKMWGRYSDSFSNKTILAISAPLYILCILLWSFTGSSIHSVTAIFLVLINVLTGFATAGVNLAINNIGIKLAPRDQAIVYISARNMIVAMFSALAPIAGGILADFFAANHIHWMIGNENFRLNLYHWNFLFLLGVVLAFCSLRLLRNIKEEGEADREQVLTIMKTSFHFTLKKRISNSALSVLILRPTVFPAYLKQKLKQQWNLGISRFKNWDRFNIEEKKTG